MPSFPQPIKQGISPETSERFSAAMGGTSGCSPSKRILISSKSSSIFSAKSTRTGVELRGVCFGSLATASNDLRVGNQLLFSKSKIEIKQTVFNCAHTKDPRPTSSIQR